MLLDTDIAKNKLMGIDPGDFVIVSCIGSDETLLVDGHDIIRMFKEDSGESKNATLDEAVAWYIKDASKNSYEMIVLEDGQMKNGQWLV